MITDIEKVTGQNFIIRFEKYVVVCGKMLHIFTTSGTLLFRRKDLVNCYKVTYIPDDKLLLDICGEKYCLISLLDGKDIWNIPQTKRMSSAKRFAVSPSSDFAFDFYEKYNVSHLVCIDINKAEISEKRIEKAMRATLDIMCNQEGIPCLLQTQYTEMPQERLSENAIVQANLTQAKADKPFSLCRTWKYNGNRIAHFFLENTDQILTNDLHVYCPSTGTIINLLENETTWDPQVYAPSAYHLDATKRYLILKYQSANVVIGLDERKVIAKYAAPFTDGCIVDNEFWVSRENIVQRKPFPIIEDVQHFKYSTWKPYLR